MEERFKSEGFNMYVQLQNLLLFAAKKEPFEAELNLVLEFYGDDFNEERLRSQMKTFSRNFETKQNVKIEDIIVYFKTLNPGLKSLLSEVCKVMELVLVLPATTAEGERCFSRLKLVKTHLRTTISQEHLNHFMVMGIYPNLVDKLDSNKIADEFISRCYNNTRKKLFGQGKQ